MVPARRSSVHGRSYPKRASLRAAFGLAAVLLLLLGCAGCRNSPSGDVEHALGVAEPPEPPPPGPSSPGAAAGGAGKGEEIVALAPPPSNEALLKVGGQTVRIAQAEALAIRAALVDRIRQSDVPYKAELIARTKDAPIAFEPELARIGLWILSESGGRMQLLYREPSTAPVSFFYRAYVSNREGRWQVTDLTYGELRRR